MTPTSRTPPGRPTPDGGHSTPPVPRTRTWARRLAAGGWYFAVTIFTGGFLAAVPFWHAAARLGRPALRRLALVYTGIDAFLVVLMALTPEPNPDGSSGNSAISPIGAITVVAVVVVACIQLRGLRREVYGQPDMRPASADPAVARALAARARRAEARQLYSTDPVLARELGIGRPDLDRGYDDGGLVDLNTADASLIATVSGIEQEHADAIIAARSARVDGYFNLDELFIDLSLPPHVQEQLREHAIV